MIVADLAHLRDQVVLTPNMETAIAYLLSSGQDERPDGRVVVDGDKVYVEVQSYNTTEGPVTRFEGHRKYIDIQYVAAGEEIIGWAPLSAITETTSYVPEHDYWLGEAEPARVTPISLTAGQLAVFYPTDPHSPRHGAGAAQPVKKLVVKVAVEG
jgi:biofilm protein TabA